MGAFDDWAVEIDEMLMVWAAGYLDIDEARAGAERLAEGRR